MHFCMSQISPPDVITQSHDEWLYIIYFNLGPVHTQVLQIGHIFVPTSALLCFITLRVNPDKPG
jgi:hypothetical protein